MSTATLPTTSVQPATAPPITPAARTAVPPRFQTAQEWLDSLGDVELSRIVFDPWPGTATEADMVRMNDVEDRPVELIGGTLVEKAVGDYDALIGYLIGHAILNFVLPRKLGAVTGEQGMKRTKPGQVRMPDVSFTSFARMPGGKVGRESITSAIPDLIVEVLSVSNTTREIELKLEEFFAAGTRLAWVVDPRAETAEVYHKPGTPDATLHDGDSLDGEDVLPGFTLSLHELFHTYD